ncbi:MAG TPA: formylglycine-generating enzyme family protein [Thermoanaerobaculia bacterium]|jgi:formylglycine-generating enzyme required for sulfatase activity
MTDRYRATAARVAVFLPALWLAFPPAARAAEPAKTALVLVSGTACAVSLDGSKVADMNADEPLRIEVAPGEYVLSALAADGRRWSRVLQAEGAKILVRIDFGRNDAPSSGAAAPALVPVAPPAAAAAPRTGAASGAVRPTPAPASSASALSWVRIPAGEFEMGCSDGDTECSLAELPRLPAAVKKPFEIMDRLVTVAQYRDWAVGSQRKSPVQPAWSTNDSPLVNVTWDEAVAFCSAVSGRLPSEIEWEYAARAGTTGPRYGELDAIAWYAGNSERRARGVGTKLANGFGLYDMLGNAWEWNADVYRSTLAAARDGGTSAGPNDMRSLRGGAWRSKARQIRVSNRGRLAPDEREDDNGFRCARDAAPR